MGPYLGSLSMILSVTFCHFFCQKNRMNNAMDKKKQELNEKNTTPKFSFSSSVFNRAKLRKETRIYSASTDINNSFHILIYWECT